MGRPRKRRRGSEPGGDDTLLADVNDNLNDFNIPSVHRDYGLVTPPQFQDSDIYIHGNIADSGAPMDHYLADPSAFGISPGSNLKYVKTHDFNEVF
jgi:hypothetical protein